MRYQGRARTKCLAVIDQPDAAIHQKYARRTFGHAHGLSSSRSAHGESRIRKETIAAEDIPHDLGALSMISSDSQAMSRFGEVIVRCWQTADKMRRQRGSLP